MAPVMIGIDPPSRINTGSRLNADRIARLGISAASGAALAHAKTAKATQLNLLALVQGFNDAFKNDFD